jgi:hypothetical protein
MPTVNYAFSNTPPTGVPSASQAPNNGAPGAVPLPSMAGTGNNAAAVAFPSQSPNNGAPVALTVPANVPDNTPAAAVPLSYVANNSAPAAVAFPSMAGNNGAPAAVPVAANALDNTPPAAVALASTAPVNGAPASVPNGSAPNLNEAPRAIGYTPIPATATDETVNTPILKIEGVLALNNIYGQTRVPSPSVLDRVQIALESAPVGGPATITLVDAAGVSYGVAVTVNAGENFGETVPGAPVALLAGANVRAKCTATPGGNDPGGFGVVTLFTRLSS